MAKDNRADGRRSDWYDSVSGATCGTCGGSGSQVDGDGRHVDACGTCGGTGKTR